jgi:hypothetical protein
VLTVRGGGFSEPPEAGGEGATRGSEKVSSETLLSA